MRQLSTRRIECERNEALEAVRNVLLLSKTNKMVDSVLLLVDAFEDAPLGIEAARRAGMRAVAIASTVPADELGAPPHVVARAQDFTQLVARELAALVECRRS